ncbi:hypothetical protein H4R18_004328 [Coemansia javaensis]|uniref:Chitosanase n=1 Tax=Coemansia javaensis TaxID=2761396 RepID=A0A9W8HB33_9FUNG|nr:hypothetical protein H4R18_004328 [Coemansia javaensis]
MKLARHSPAAVLAMSLLGGAAAGLSGCPQNLAFQLTNVFQFGHIQFSYDACTYDPALGGYRAGIANFNTVDGSAWNVIQIYHGVTGGRDEFSQYNDSLKGSTRNNGGGSKDPLKGFCGAWKSAATKMSFQSSQGTVFTSKYFAASQNMADSLGLSLSISKAQLYDTAISNGPGSGKDALGGIVAATNSNFTSDVPGVSGSLLNINGRKVDEIKWLQAFLAVRSQYSDAPGAKASINSYTYMINNMISTYTNDDRKDRGVFQWGTKIIVLNDAGQPGDCHTSARPTRSPTQSGGDGSGDGGDWWNRNRDDWWDHNSDSVVCDGAPRAAGASALVAMLLLILAI